MVKKRNIKEKISSLIKKRYKEAAFGQKRHAEMFISGWKEKGFETAVVRSSGPTVEGAKYKRNAYYVIAMKKKLKKKKVKKRVRKKLRSSDLDLSKGVTTKDLLKGMY